MVDFTTLKTVEPIQRESGQRRAALMVNLKTRDIEGYVRAAEKGIREQVKLPDGYIVEFGGQFQNLQEARARLAVVVPAALLLIFVLIFLAFGSLRQALLIYSGIPLAVTGGVLALWLRGMPFSITAAVGFIALATVVIGGIISSTFLTLVVLPVLYAWAERRSKNSSPGSPGTSIAAELPNP